MKTLEELKSIFHTLYADDDTVIDHQLSRYRKLDAQFVRHFGLKTRHLFSTPGRTEIGGNHTDHNHGRVLAASVNMDSIAIACPVESGRVILYSEGYPKPFIVDLEDSEIHETEKGTTEALIRGIAARLKELGYATGGFEGVMTSSVLPGSGLSSSASVEVLIGTIFNTLYNGGTIEPARIAQTGQYAENHYFGKPCGLMDQMACAVGGIITIDFRDPYNPVVEKVPFDFAGKNYSLIVVDTGGNHADLTDDYAAIPAEMKAVAGAFHEAFMRNVPPDTLLGSVPELRKKHGDRALLRALHFVTENERVLEQVRALQADDFDAFLNLVNASGNSSFKWLQNIYTTKNVKEQGVSLALFLSESFIRETGEGACRVHGGGFAGTIQVFLPNDAVEAFRSRMEPVFGAGSVHVLNIRPAGSLHLGSVS